MKKYTQHSLPVFINADYMNQSANPIGKYKIKKQRQKGKTELSRQFKVEPFHVRLPVLDFL